jgi:hypothetical protein
MVAADREAHAGAPATSATATVLRSYPVPAITVFSPGLITRIPQGGSA